MSTTSQGWLSFGAGSKWNRWTWSAGPIRRRTCADQGRKERVEASDHAVTAPTPTLPAEAREAVSKPARPPDAGDLPRAAQALLDAWDGFTVGGHADVTQIIGPIAALRAALAASASAHQPIERASLRPDTKQAQVLTMLVRDEGASGPQIAEAMGWAPHTVRGFLAGLAKKGMAAGAAAPQATRASPRRATKHAQRLRNSKLYYLEL